MNEAAYRAILKRLGVEIEEAKPTMLPSLPRDPAIPRSYAFPWPDEVLGLGPRCVRAFEPCAECGGGTWVGYGEMALCLRCAVRLGKGPA